MLGAVLEEQMRVEVRVKPGSKKPGIEEENGQLVVRVAEQAREGAANEAVQRALAKHFGVPPTRVELLRGQSSRIKLFEISER